MDGGSAYYLSHTLLLRSGRTSIGHAGRSPGDCRCHKDKKQSVAVLPALQGCCLSADLSGAGIHLLQGSVSRPPGIGWQHLRSLRALLHDPAGEGGQRHMRIVTALRAFAPALNGHDIQGAIHLGLRFWFGSAQ